MSERYFDREGRRITADAAHQLRQIDEYRVVALDSDDGVKVSTVWLGLDRGFGEEPVIFETMIFGGAHDGEYLRSSTEEEARAAHAKIVASTFGVAVACIDSGGDVDIIRLPSMAEARAFARGAMYGAGKYGGCELGAYVAGDEDSEADLAEYDEEGGEWAARAARIRDALKGGSGRE